MSVKIVKSNKNQDSTESPKLKLVKNSSSSTPSTLSDELIFKAALEYKAKGWHVLPLNEENYCSLNKKEQEAYKTPIPQDFNQGVGVNLGLSGMVGMDIDCKEVVPFLEAFLPQTTTTHRESKAASWMFFKLKGEIANNISFDNCDSEGKKSPELGGIKFKAVTPLPPTIHAKSQESLKWTGYKKATTASITAKELIATASRCFGLTLIAQRWPTKGSRHYAYLALAGALAHAKWSLEDAQKAVRALVKVTNDDELNDRLATVNTTYSRIQNGEKVNGLTSLINDYLSTSSDKERVYLKEKLNAWLRGTTKLEKENPLSDKPVKSFVECCYSPLGLQALKPPPVSYIVHNFLPEKDTVNLFGAEGIGKTLFCLQLALDVARGHNFFEWTVNKPYRVLYIDGEMTASQILDRIRALVGDDGVQNPKIEENLQILPTDLMLADDVEPNIYDESFQQWVDVGLQSFETKGEKIDLIILDNLASLGYGVDENSNTEIQVFLRWARKLKAKGYAVLYVTHAGKNGENRGASAKGGAVHTTIKLITAKEKDCDGASFEISFPKHRGLIQKPYKWAVKLVPNDDGRSYWESNAVKDIDLLDRVLITVIRHKPKTQKELAELMECSEANLTKPIKRAEDKGYLIKKPLAITLKGEAYIKPAIEKLEEYESNM